MPERVKLTAAQRAALRKARRTCIWCQSGWQVGIDLARMGLVTAKRRTYGYTFLDITPAGRAAIEGEKT
jgi:hypothetical protein